ncbi:MAG TPA: GNAT family N-acetyltransferase [Jatrophihabitantaceae bacterium]|jgi:GNAT superfamily N-acetyltransferase
MTLTVTTDPSAIDSVLTRLLDADPVRATVIGSIVVDLRAGRAPDAWCAGRPGTDAVVVRSHRAYPVLFTAGWDGADLAEAIELVGRLPGLTGVSGPAEIAEAAAGRLAGERATERMGMRLFRLDDLVPPTGVPGEGRPANDDEHDLVLDWYRAFGAEAGGAMHDIEQAAANALASGRIWLWLDGGRPVSLAARRAPEAGSARIGPVYTPPEHRGHGYGSAVTAAATRDVLDLGAIPVLFTDLANPTSNKIYQLLGYYPVEDRAVVRFD